MLTIQHLNLSSMVGRSTVSGRPSHTTTRRSLKETVSLKVSDPANEDSFQRANITELVITPEGDFHAYNVKVASQFVRSDARIARS